MINFRFFARFVLFFGFLLQSSLAFSMTMTFDTIKQVYSYYPGQPKTYTENGITASPTFMGADFGYWNQPGTLHLDDSGDTAISKSVSFTTGNIFDAVSLDTSSGPSNLSYQLFNTIDSSVIDASNVPYDNVGIQGYREGSLVADDNFYMGDVNTYLFDASFSDIDTLIVSALYPNLASIEAALLSQFPGYIVGELGCWGAQPCGHFDIDNLVLNPVQVSAVPVPPAAWLFGSALFGFFGFSRRKANI